MFNAMLQGNSYGSTRVTGKAQVTQGDTYIVNHFHFGSRLSNTADSVDAGVNEPTLHSGRNEWLTSKAASGPCLAPTNAGGDISARLGPKSGSVAVVEVFAIVLRIARICNNVAKRLDDLKYDASLKSLECGIKLVSLTVEFLRPVLERTPSNEDNDETLKACLAQIEYLLVKINEEGLATWTLSGNTNLIKSVFTSRQTRMARQRLRTLEIELDKQRETLSTYVSTCLSTMSGCHETGTRRIPVSPSALVSPGNRQSHKSICEQGLCQCLCHAQLRQRGGFIVERPAYPLLHCSCQKREVWVSIAMLQKIWSVRLGLEWAHGLTMDWSLSYRNTVKHINAGTIVLAKCAHGVMDFAEARKELTRLRTANEFDFADIDRQGDGLLEVRNPLNHNCPANQTSTNPFLQLAIRQPWDLSYQDLQFQLIRWLVEVGTPINSERCVHMSHS